MQLVNGLSRVRRSTFVRHSGLVFGSSMLVNICAFVFHARASRLLGVEDYGALYALMALLPLFGIPAAVLSTVVTKYAAEFQALHDSAHLHTLVRRMAFCLAAVGALLVAIGLALQKPISDVLHVPQRAIVPTSFLIAFTLMLPPLRSVLQGVQDFGRYAVSSALEGLLKAGLGILFAVMGFRVAGALGGYAFGSAIALLYTWAVLERIYGGPSTGQLHFDLRRLLQTLGGAAVLTVSINALSYADALIVKHSMSAQEAGLYAAISLGGKIVLFIASFVPLVLLPKATSRTSQGISPLPVLGAAAALWALLSVATLLWFYFAPALILRILVGPQFLAAAHLLFYYALAMALLGAMNLVANYQIALHRFDFVYPFIVVTIGELGGIALYHPNLGAVVGILIVGNALAVLGSFYGVRTWSAQA